MLSVAAAALSAPVDEPPAFDGERGASSSTPLEPPGGSSSTLPVHQFYPWYHSTAQIEAQLDELGAAHGVELRTLHAGGQTGNGRNMYALQTVSADEPRSLEADARRRAKGSEARPRAMVLGGMHPRELIGSEIAFQLAQMAAGTKPAHVPQQLQDRLDRVKESVDLSVLPVVNGNGRERVDTYGEWCVRNNANDVDLNRNFDSFWSHTEPGAGASPFSEHETSVLKGYAQEFISRGDDASASASGSSAPAQSRSEALLERDSEDEDRQAAASSSSSSSAPSLFLTLHSGQQAMFMPNAGSREPHRDADGMYRVLKALNDEWPTVRSTKLGAVCRRRRRRRRASLPKHTDLP